MAALEAKRASTHPVTAQNQGKNYAEQLSMPFVFLSNGEEVRFLDRETSISTLDAWRFGDEDPRRPPCRYESGGLMSAITLRLRCVSGT